MTGYGCPFCGDRVDWTAVLEEMVLRAFEAHLDRHMARGDQLLVRLSRGVLASQRARVERVAATCNPVDSDAAAYPKRVRLRPK